MTSVTIYGDITLVHGLMPSYCSSLDQIVLSAVTQPLYELHESDNITEHQLVSLVPAMGANIKREGLALLRKPTVSILLIPKRN